MKWEPATREPELSHISSFPEVFQLPHSTLSYNQAVLRGQGFQSPPQVLWRSAAAWVLSLHTAGITSLTECAWSHCLEVKLSSQCSPQWHSSFTLFISVCFFNVNVAFSPFSTCLFLCSEFRWMASSLAFPFSFLFHSSFQVCFSLRPIMNTRMWLHCDLCILCQL